MWSDCDMAACTLVQCQKDGICGRRIVVWPSRENGVVREIV